MNIDHTELLKALKHPQPEATEEEKMEAANERHELPRGKEPGK